MIITKKKQSIFIGFKKEEGGEEVTVPLIQKPTKGLVFEFESLSNVEYLKAESILQKNYKAMVEEKIEEDISIGLVNYVSGLVKQIHNVDISKEDVSYLEYFKLLMCLISESKVSDTEALFLD